MDMKLVGFSMMAALLFAAPAARADDEVLNPPSGPVVLASNPPAVPQGPRGPVDPAVRAQRQAKVRQLRQALLQTFDANGDGRLEPQERRQAMRALRRIERKLGGGPQGADRRQMKMRKFIQKYDTNHDGNVGPGEMPPNQAKRLRRFDRNGDGWVTPNELETPAPPKAPQ
jgi:EF hand domain-containing protein